MKTKKGFTLIELLIVIVIIGILAAIVIGIVGTSAQQKARDAARAAGIHGIQSALELYKSDNATYPADEAAAQAALTGGADPYMKQWPALQSPDVAWGYEVRDGGACYYIGVAKERGGGMIEATCQQ